MSSIKTVFFRRQGDIKTKKVNYVTRNVALYFLLLREDILKVPKREIFDRSNFPDFYAIKSSWVGDLVVKILTYYFIF
jgi:hypothetical protein